jgi:uncharacterized protein (DUF952 family)
MSGSKPIYHVAFDEDWDAALTVGTYRVSARGMTLESEGFLHFSYAHQLGGVAQRFWRHPEAPVVLLTVDPDLLDAPVVDENTSGGTELFPHLYGPLPVAAVVRVTPIDVDPDGNLLLPDLSA